MPTYGYRCTVCAHEFERFQKITDPALTDCESCGGTVKKILYPVGIQFVGSGFYVNDYAKSGGNGAAKDNGAAAAAASGSKPESKSEAKSDSGAGSSTTSTPAGAGTSGTSSS